LHPKYAIAFAKVDPHQACPLRKSIGIFSPNGQVNSLPKDVDVWDFNSFVLLIDCTDPYIWHCCAECCSWPLIINTEISCERTSCNHHFFGMICKFRMHWINGLFDWQGLDVARAVEGTLVSFVLMTAQGHIFQPWGLLWDVFSH
jgi:hypothetical protein